MSRSLMLVEDDQRLGELLCSYLGQNGYTVSWESRGTGLSQKSWRHDRIW